MRVLMRPGYKAQIWDLKALSVRLDKVAFAVIRPKYGI